jgi:hypothetical protein
VVKDNEKEINLLSQFCAKTKAEKFVKKDVKDFWE